MKTFKTFVAENVDTSSWMKRGTVVTIEDVETFLNTCVGNGEIMKKDWDRAKYTISHVMEKDWDDAKNLIWNFSWQFIDHRNKNTWTEDEIEEWEKTPMSKLGDKSIVNISQIDSVKKLVDAARKGKSKYGKFYDESYITPVENFWKRYSSVCKLHTGLKSKIVTVSHLRDVKKQEKQSTFDVMKTNAQVMIDALMDHMKDIKKYAGENASEYVDNQWELLKDRNWDVYDEMMSNKAYGKDSLQRFLGVTEVDPKSREKNEKLGGSFRTNERFRISSKSIKKRVVDSAMQNAEEDYKEFIGKMVMKIGGGIVGANVKGHPWRGSTLTVEMVDGTNQVWNTQMIINYSKYGKPFNQFPSRRKK